MPPPEPGDELVGEWKREQLEAMDRAFRAAVEREMEKPDDDSGGTLSPPGAWSERYSNTWGRTPRAVRLHSDPGTGFVIVRRNTTQQEKHHGLTQR
jgi:hypothetical protein